MPCSFFAELQLAFLNDNVLRCRLRTSHVNSAEIAKPKQTCKTIFLWTGNLANAKHWPEGWLDWKPISGILLKLAGCLLTQNILISLHRALSAQSVDDIRLATQRWADGATNQGNKAADYLTDGFPFKQACHLYFLLLTILIKHCFGQESV